MIARQAASDVAPVLEQVEMAPAALVVGVQMAGLARIVAGTIQGIDGYEEFDGFVVVFVEESDLADGERGFHVQQFCKEGFVRQQHGRYLVRGAMAAPRTYGQGESPTTIT